MKIEGSGSGSIGQRHGSADPDSDPHQNVIDPQHWSWVISVWLTSAPSMKTTLARFFRTGSMLADTLQQARRPTLNNTPGGVRNAGEQCLGIRNDFFRIRILILLFSAGFGSES
jgi:hypothetical protein